MHLLHRFMDTKWNSPWIYHSSQCWPSVLVTFSLSILSVHTWNIKERFCCPQQYTQASSPDKKHMYFNRKGKNDVESYHSWLLGDMQLETLKDLNAWRRLLRPRALKAACPYELNNLTVNHSNQDFAPQIYLVKTPKTSVWRHPPHFRFHAALLALGSQRTTFSWFSFSVASPGSGGFSSSPSPYKFKVPQGLVPPRLLHLLPLLPALVDFSVPCMLTHVPVGCLPRVSTSASKRHLEISTAKQNWAPHRPPNPALPESSLLPVMALPSLHYGHPEPLLSHSTPNLFRNSIGSPFKIHPEPSLFLQLPRLPAVSHQHCSPG